MTTRIVMGLVVFALATPAAGYAADLAKGRKIIVEHCEKCHGRTGKGDGTMLKRIKADVKPADWTKKTEMAKWSDADLAKIITQGGQQAGHSKVMPSFGEKLSAADVADVVAYIRSLAK